MTKYKPVTKVVFDLDGTLIDTENFYHKTITEILGEYGKQLDEELHSKIVGLIITKSAQIMIDHCQLPLQADELIEKVLVKYQENAVGNVQGQTNVQFLPGVTRLVHHLHKHAIPMAICTGSMKRTYTFKVCCPTL